MQHEDVKIAEPIRRPDIQFLNQVIDELNKYIKENPDIFSRKKIKINIEELEAMQRIANLIYQYAYKEDAPRIDDKIPFEKLSFNEKLLPATPEAFRILHKKMVAVLQKMKIDLLKESKLQKNIAQLINKLSQTAYDNFKREWSILNPQNINTMPTEILAEILSYTTPSQQASLARVNKKFQKTLDTEKNLSNNINKITTAAERSRLQQKPNENNKAYAQRLFKQQKKEQTFLVVRGLAFIIVIDGLNDPEYESKLIEAHNENVFDNYGDALTYATAHFCLSYTIEINLHKDDVIQHNNDHNFEAIKKKIVKIEDHLRDEDTYTTYRDGKLVEIEPPSKTPFSKG